MDPFTMTAIERQEMAREWFMLFLKDKVEVKLYVRMLLWLDYDEEAIIRSVNFADGLKLSMKDLGNK